MIEAIVAPENCSASKIGPTSRVLSQNERPRGEGELFITKARSKKTGPLNVGGLLV